MILLRILAYDQNNPPVMGQDAAPYLHKLVALLRHKQGPEAPAAAKAAGGFGAPPVLTVPYLLASPALTFGR